VRNEAVSGKDDKIILLLQKRSSLTTAYLCIDKRVSDGTRSINVTATAIASILRSVDGPIALLKIDCEGAEYEIFDGLDDEAAADVRQVTMELHAVEGRSHHEIIRKLKAFGFAVHSTYPMLTAVRL
jgi:FkbM family methyltransferase